MPRFSLEVNFNRFRWLIYNMSSIFPSLVLDDVKLNVLLYTKANYAGIISRM